MPIKRVFLGWMEPGLVAGARWVVARYRTRTALDLAEVSMVLPTHRDGRHFLQVLAQAAKTELLSFIVPRFGTVDDWPNQVVAPAVPLADAPVRQLAWTSTLRSHSGLPDVLPGLADEGNRACYQGTALDRLHAELAAQELTFADIAQRIARRTRQPPGEAERWKMLAELEARYLERLKRAGLTDPHAAQLDGLRRQACRAECDLVFLGVVGLTRLQCRMLDQVADRTTVLIVAPEERSDCFDEYGQLRAEEWRHRPIAIADSQIHFAETPRDQAELVMRAISAEQSRSVARDISVMIADDELGPFVVQRLGASGIDCRPNQRQFAGQSPPAQLLQAISELLKNARVSDTAALFRHPDLEAWLRARNPDLQAGWIDELDRYSARRLPSQISPHWPEDRDQWPALSEAWSDVQRLVEPLTVQTASTLQSVDAVARILEQVYSEQVDSVSASACEIAADFLRKLRFVPAELAPPLIPIDVLQLLNEHLASVPIVAAHSQVDLLDWPSLLLDDRRTLVVAGFNEGRVPARDERDWILLPALKRELGLADADARYARDAYTLQVILASRRQVRLIAGRRSADGEPLLPSRLLFACDPQTRARRILRFVKPALEDLPAAVSERKSGFVVPRPRPRPKPRPAVSPPRPSMRLEQFGDYLACKYRFYLRHVLKLRSVKMHTEELDGAGFASLIHAVLGQFGHAEVKHETNPAAIRDFVTEALDRLTNARFGDAVPPLIALQIGQARQRLSDFAEWQAQRVREGWRIVCCEAEVNDDSVPFPDGEPLVHLRGKIDRIDVRDGNYLILDYRTSETEQPPEKTHRQRGEWTDLSLPLARHLAGGLGIEVVQFGHLVLPKARGRVAVLSAAWTEADLRDADETARRVISAILAGEFEPDTLAPPPYSDAYSWICQDHQFIADDDAEVEETA